MADGEGGEEQANESFIYTVLRFAWFSYVYVFVSPTNHLLIGIQQGCKTAYQAPEATRTCFAFSNQPISHDLFSKYLCYKHIFRRYRNDA